MYEVIRANEAILDVPLSSGIASVGLTMYEGAEINPTIIVQAHPCSGNRMMVHTVRVKPHIYASTITGGKGVGYLVGRPCSPITTPDGSVLVIWNERPENERAFQPELNRIARVMRGIRCLATAF